MLSLENDDVLAVVTNGGGGWGDPLARDPQRVALDVQAQLVSLEAARSIYGVALDAAGAPDEGQTETLRRGVLADRRTSVKAVTTGESSVTSTGSATGTDLQRCAVCDDREGSVADLSGFPSGIRPLTAAGPETVASVPPARFGLREWYCPGCWRLLEVGRELL